MGNGPGKQFLLLDNLPVLVHTLRKFESAERIDHVLLVVPGADIEFTREMIVSKYGLSKVKHILPGGRERQDSVKNGLDAVAADVGFVAIHDGVRPFITGEIIDRVILKGLECNAVTLGVPVKETIKRVDKEGRVGKTLKREGLWIAQTPQVFKREIIVEAHRRACADGYYATDDASLVERMGMEVFVMPGSYENIKITTPDDLAYGEFILKGKHSCSK